VETCRFAAVRVLGCACHLSGVFVQVALGSHRFFILRSRGAYVMVLFLSWRILTMPSISTVFLQVAPLVHALLRSTTTLLNVPRSVSLV
jgi:hypothetical protein